jgi:hypothetical protein
LAVVEGLPRSIFTRETRFAYVAFTFRLAEIYVPFVDVTQLFSLRENAIAKEPGVALC